MSACQGLDLGRRRGPYGHLENALEDPAEGLAEGFRAVPLPRCRLSQGRDSEPVWGLSSASWGAFILKEAFNCLPCKRC